MKKNVITKGGINVSNIKIGDVHYEYEYGIGIKCKVVSLPERSEDGYWSWKSENLTSGGIIDYGVKEGMSHYGPNLYDYEAYSVKNYI